MMNKHGRLPALFLLLVLLALPAAQAEAPNATSQVRIGFAYTKPEYTIQATATAGGMISPEGAVTVTAGEDYVFAFTPLAGYRLAGVYVDNSPLTWNGGAPWGYRFIRVIADHTLHAVFEPIATATAVIPVEAPTARPTATVLVRYVPATARATAAATAAPVSRNAVATYVESEATEPPARDDVPPVFAAPRNLGMTGE